MHLDDVLGLGLDLLLELGVEVFEHLQVLLVLRIVRDEELVADLAPGTDKMVDVDKVYLVVLPVMDLVGPAVLLKARKPLVYPLVFYHFVHMQTFEEGEHPARSGIRTEESVIQVERCKARAALLHDGIYRGIIYVVQAHPVGDYQEDNLSHDISDRDQLDVQLEYLVRKIRDDRDSLRDEQQQDDPVRHVVALFEAVHEY